MSPKISNLTSNLIVRKGEASPAVSKKNNVPINEHRNTLRKKSGTIAVTLRLDPERYEKLKLHGVYNRLTNQDIILAALDNYFKDDQRKF